MIIQITTPQDFCPHCHVRSNYFLKASRFICSYCGKGVNLSDSTIPLLSSDRIMDHNEAIKIKKAAAGGY